MEIKFTITWIALQLYHLLRGERLFFANTKQNCYDRQSV